MKRLRFKIIVPIIAAMAPVLTSCGGNNGDMPAESDFENTTETAPEATDNMTGYGELGDSTSVPASADSMQSGTTTE